MSPTHLGVVCILELPRGALWQIRTDAVRLRFHHVVVLALLVIQQMVDAGVVEFTSDSPCLNSLPATWHRTVGPLALHPLDDLLPSHDHVGVLVLHLGVSASISGDPVGESLRGEVVVQDDGGAGGLGSVGVALPLPGVRPRETTDHEVARLADKTGLVCAPPGTRVGEFGMVDMSPDEVGTGEEFDWTLDGEASAGEDVGLLPDLQTHSSYLKETNKK